MYLSGDDIGVRTSHLPVNETFGATNTAAMHAGGCGFPAVYFGLECPITIFENPERNREESIRECPRMGATTTARWNLGTYPRCKTSGKR